MWRVWGFIWIFDYFSTETQEWLEESESEDDGEEEEEAKGAEGEEEEDESEEEDEDEEGKELVCPYTVTHIRLFSTHLFLWLKMSNNVSIKIRIWLTNRSWCKVRGPSTLFVPPTLYY